MFRYFSKVRVGTLLCLSSSFHIETGLKQDFYQFFNFDIEYSIREVQGAWLNDFHKVLIYADHVKLWACFRAARKKHEDIILQVNVENSKFTEQDYELYVV